MKNIIISIVCIAFISIVIYFSYLSGQKYQSVKLNGSIETCTIMTRGSDVICSFTIDGKNETRRLSKPHNYIKSNEMYNVYYWDKIPDTYYISWTEPVIIENEYTETITESFSKNGTRLTFTYIVNGIVFERIQEISDEIIINPKKEYKVLFKKEDPEIAYVVSL